MQINRQSCECLLDTGSDVTLIPATLIKDEPIQSSTYVLKAANGTEIPILGEVSLAFKLGGYTGIISGLVSEHVSEVILGINWLTCHSVTWEFGEARIRLNGRYFNFIVAKVTRCGTGESCCRLT